MNCNKGPDEFFQRHLYTGRVLTAPVPGNDHSHVARSRSANSSITTMAPCSTPCAASAGCCCRMSSAWKAKRRWRIFSKCPAAMSCPSVSGGQGGLRWMSCSKVCRNCRPDRIPCRGNPSGGSEARCRRCCGGGRSSAIDRAVETRLRDAAFELYLDGAAGVVISTGLHETRIRINVGRLAACPTRWTAVSLRKNRRLTPCLSNCGITPWSKRRRFTAERRSVQRWSANA